jgi:metal-sulfur cluster biosynthetic enzyme
MSDAAAVDQAGLMEALKQVFDPEIGINIVDLGLVYELVEREGMVDVKMTLTAIGCPAAGPILQEVKDRLEAQPGVRGANVELVFSPPWSPDLLSEDAKTQLGFGY